MLTQQPVCILDIHFFPFLVSLISLHFPPHFFLPFFLSRPCNYEDGILFHRCSTTSFFVCVCVCLLSASWCLVPRWGSLDVPHLLVMKMRERGRKRRHGAAVTHYKGNTGLTNDYWKQMATPRTTGQLVSIELEGNWVECNFNVQSAGWEFRCEKYTAVAAMYNNLTIPLFIYPFLHVKLSKINALKVYFWISLFFLSSSIHSSSFFNHPPPPHPPPIKKLQMS